MQKGKEKHFGQKDRKTYMEKYKTSYVYGNSVL